MRIYDFTVGMSGRGNTPEEAWTQVVEHLLDNLQEFANTSDLPYHISVEVEDE